MGSGRLLAVVCTMSTSYGEEVACCTSYLIPSVKPTTNPSPSNTLRSVWRERERGGERERGRERERERGGERGRERGGERERGRERGRLFPEQLLPLALEATGPVPCDRFPPDPRGRKWGSPYARGHPTKPYCLALS